MRIGRWLDHLPPWLAWMAMLSTGIFEPVELVGMATPLALALGVELRRWHLGRWEAWLNASALVYLAVLWALGIQLIPGTAFLLFYLCAVRLILPRTVAHRRQLLLMGFLVFLLGALAAFDLIFGLWLLLWLVLLMASLLQHAWEGSAHSRAGLHPRPPFRKLAGYGAATLVLGGLMFLALPRLTFGLRPQFLPQFGWSTSQAGLSDRLDLAGSGPVTPNSEIVLRLVPRGALAEDPDLAQRQLGLLRALVLERLEGQTWSALDQLLSTDSTVPVGPTHQAELFLAPSPLGIIPLPYAIQDLGNGRLGGPFLRRAEGESLRLAFPSRQVLSIPLTLSAPRRGLQPSRILDAEGPLTQRRQTLLTYPGEDTEAARKWSLEVAPQDLPATELVRVLVARLRTFRYTITNPAAQSANPLASFLGEIQAGHCEYFASALAIMLRHRGIPSRVVNGYRLGPWIAEGGYYLVTQNEAHSWVEYYDATRERWAVADPTPAAPPSAWQGSGLTAAVQRSMDALRFRWDRYVVRFSDADQVAGLEWIRERAETLSWREARLAWLRPVLVALFVGLGLWRLHRSGFPLFDWLRRKPQGHLPQLRPLLRLMKGRLEARPGESARSWLRRLAAQRPDQRSLLLRLADEAEAVAYGARTDQQLRRWVSEAVTALKKPLS